MIDDPELRSLFRAEADEHLEALHSALHRLESAPADRNSLDAAFREAHSLKGAAGMLGVTPVQRLSHRFEDILGEARRGITTLTREVVDVLSAHLDAIRQLVDEAVTGVPSGIDPEAVLERIAGRPGTVPPVPTAPAVLSPAEAPRSPVAPPPPIPVADVSPRAFSADQPPPVPASVRAGPADPVSVPVAVPVLAVPVAPKPPPAPSGAAAGTPVSDPGAAAPVRQPATTVRVETQRLDDLLRWSGELSVAQVRIGRRLAELRKLSGRWDDASNDLLALRLLVPDLERGSREALRRLPALLDRVTQDTRSAVESLGAWITATDEESSRLEQVTEELESGIRATRLLPLGSLFGLLQRSTRALARELGKEVSVVIEGGETGADKQIVDEIKDPLMHLLRNAVDHGLEPPEQREQRGKPGVGTIRLRAYQTGTSLVIVVEDDGRGIDLEAVRRSAIRRGLYTAADLRDWSPAQLRLLIFEPGFSTRAEVSDISGRGVGMDVVRANVERLKGTIELDSEPGRGSSVRLRLPRTVTTTHALIIQVAGQPYALPVDYVEVARDISLDELFTVEGRDTLLHAGEPLPITRMADLLELAAHGGGARQEEPGGKQPCLVLSVGGDRFGVLVDRLIEEQEVVLKPLGAVLRRVRNISGATNLGTGEVCIVLNPADLQRSLARLRSSGLSRAARPETPASDPNRPDPNRPRSVLLADDSITVRTQIRRVLEGGGYLVTAAVDGQDALERLRQGRFDALVSDVEMPNLTGLELVTAVRRDPALAGLPVVLVTTLTSDEDRKRGFEAGASAYLPKPAFDQRELLETLRTLTQ
jgi:two-component system chemotaxis sensor kinase CheA